MGLNCWCPELRGAASPNQARYYCPFAVPNRRSSMPRHRGFKMEKLGQNKKFNFFSEITVKIWIFSSQEGYNFRAWGRNYVTVHVQWNQRKR